mmetsp:Transcript_17520/g.23632  ORF Transcript_17520/g.23632 Transcript_17520/m.23632 type:complete len:82 (-) Transcript_17520:683-928(-)
MLHDKNQIPLKIECLVESGEEALPDPPCLRSELLYVFIDCSCVVHFSRNSQVRHHFIHPTHSPLATIELTNNRIKMSTLAF